MRKLNVNEVQEVNGGVYGVVIGWAAGHAMDYVISRYVDYWSSAVGNGWGANPSMPEPNAGFGTI
ncbi:hypothetical protein ACSLBF_03490 [Pseudoalteromonas sp. T1lg65]|uniref:hypothetical protein n=1 Tax=Pseudoalteromonas sp. T1lg65 TaxID=2077101 RepID=UPI003F7AD113